MSTTTAPPKLEADSKNDVDEIPVDQDQDPPEPPAAEETPIDREQDFAVTVLALPVAAIIVNQEGRVVDLNDQFSSRVGYSRADLVGRPIIDIIPEYAKGRHDALLRGYFENPTPRAMGSRESRVEVVRPDGSSVPAEIGLLPNPDRETAAALVSLLSSPNTKRREFIRTLSLSLGLGLLGMILSVLRRQYPDTFQDLPDGDLLVGAAIATLVALMQTGRTTPDRNGNGGG